MSIFLAGQQGTAANFSGYPCTFSTSVPQITATNSFGNYNYVGFSTTGTMPTGLSAYPTIYSVVSGAQTSSQFEVATALNGSTPLQVTGLGSGTIIVQNVTDTGSSNQSVYNPAGYVAVANGTIQSVTVDVAYITSGGYITAAVYQNFSPYALVSNGTPVQNPLGLTTINMNGGSIVAGLSYLVVVSYGPSGIHCGLFSGVATSGTYYENGSWLTGTWPSISYPSTFTAGSAMLSSQNGEPVAYVSGFTHQLLTVGGKLLNINGQALHN